HRARQGIGTTCMARENGDNKSAGLVYSQHARIGRFRVQVRGKQARHGTRGQEKYELVVLRKERSHLGRECRLVGLLPDLPSWTIAGRTIECPGLQPLA